MKKIVSMLLCLLLCFLFGCDNVQQQEDADVLKKPLPHSFIIYCTFEELLSSVTDVVKGKCVDIVEQKDYTEYVFQVTKRFAGEQIETIFVKESDYLASVVSSSIEFEHNRKNVYEQNKEYYLFLTRIVSVYLEHDKYLNADCFAHVPVEDINNSTMYNEPLYMHSALDKGFTEQMLVEHVQGVLNERKDNTELYKGTKYITASDMPTIITGSKHVIQVEVLDLDFDGPDRDIYNCRVTDVLKGDLKCDSVEQVIFFKDTVRQGDKYIVALAEKEPPFLLFSSKNSLFDVSQYDAIMECIN